MKNAIVVMGATSGIGRGVAKAFAQKGHDLYVCGRDKEELIKLKNDLLIRYSFKINIKVFIINILDISFIENLSDIFQEDIRGLVFCMGYKGDDISSILTINFTRAVLIIDSFAEYFKLKKSGFIIGVSSVAGDRGRQSNYHYGAAKAGLSVYLQGLRNQLTRYNVRVITVKPGFVDTRMTFGMPGLFLVANPDKIGQDIANAVNKKQDVLYLPWFWKYIMVIIKSIPEWIFKKMSL